MNLLSFLKREKSPEMTPEDLDKLRKFVPVFLGYLESNFDNVFSGFRLTELQEDLARIFAQGSKMGEVFIVKSSDETRGGLFFANYEIKPGRLHKDLAKDLQSPRLQAIWEIDKKFPRDVRFTAEYLLDDISRDQIPAVYFNFYPSKIITGTTINKGGLPIIAMTNESGTRVQLIKRSGERLDPLFYLGQVDNCDFIGKPVHAYGSREIISNSRPIFGGAKYS